MLGEKFHQLLAEDIIVGDDGYRIFWPEGMRGGLLPHHLRDIADYMDELDEPWDRQLREYFEDSAPCSTP